MNVTLRIKKIYFDEILQGIKRVEYRDVKTYYERVFREKEKIKTLTLHYQKKIKLKCDVISIDKIATPDWFKFDAKDCGSFGSEVYAIRVTNPRLI